MSHSIFVFILGLIFGSFFNVCIFRMGEDESVAHGRSRCRHCKKQIPWNLNIPVLSFFMLRGKSACCAKPLSVQYPLVELGTALLFLALFWCFGLTLQWVVYAVFCSALLVLSVIDIHHQIIPDEISLTGIPLGLVASFLTHDISWISSILGIVLGGGLFFSIAWLYEKYTGQEGLGGGDVKLLAMLGSWLGVESIMIIVVFSTFLGSVFGVTLMATGRANSKAAIPFGPFLATAATIYLFARQPLLEFFYPLFFLP